MTHKEIEKALKARGYSWRAAAKTIGKSPTALIRVCQRDLDSSNIANAICVLIDTDVEAAFPDKPEYIQDERKSEQERLIEAGRQKLIDAGLAEAV